MSTTLIIVLIIVIVAVVAIAAFGVIAARRRALRQRFGPEYDRLVEEQHSRSAAEQELRERERRHAALELREISAQDRARYAADWADVQARFVDSPSDAVRAGDELITRLLADIGYPTGNGERLEMLSVEHARTLGPYREAHEISERNARGEASTEQLRQALVHYRTLFADLLGTEPVPPASPSVDGASPERAGDVTGARASRADAETRTDAESRADAADQADAEDRANEADSRAADSRAADPRAAADADVTRVDGAARPHVADSRNR